MSRFVAAAVNMAAVIVAMGVASVLSRLRLPRPAIMAVILMLVAAAAMAAVALWLLRMYSCILWNCVRNFEQSIARNVIMRIAWLPLHRRSVAHGSLSCS